MSLQVRDIAEVIEEERSKVEAKTPITEEVRAAALQGGSAAGRHMLAPVLLLTWNRLAPWPHLTHYRNLAGIRCLFLMCAGVCKVARAQTC